MVQQSKDWEGIIWNSEITTARTPKKGKIK